jgi:hypothetical protein
MPDQLPIEPPAAPETPEAPAPEAPDELTPETFYGEHYATFQETGQLDLVVVATLAKKHKLDEKAALKEHLFFASQREAALASIYAEAGGKETWDSLLASAAADRALSKEDRQRINTTLRHPDADVRKTAISELNLRYARPSQPKVRDMARPARPAPAEPFASAKDLARAFNDPRFQSDRAYRAQVEARLTATDFPR